MDVILAHAALDGTVWGLDLLTFSGVISALF